MSAILAADMRHGTEAGHEQHVRDGEDPCAPCHHAKLLAARRRNKRKTQGFVYTIPAGKAHRRVQRWLAGGASQQDVVRHTGLQPSVVHHIVNSAPEQRIYARTWQAVMSAPTTLPLTSVGAVRRVRALTALGYSLPVIAREAGVHHDTILDIRAGTSRVVAVRVREAIAAAYERLEMTLPASDRQQERAGITRSRNLAIRNGWCPPLAYDDIDDGAETPTDWQYTGSDRHAQLDELLERGAWVSDACRVLDISQVSLEKWMDRHGRREDFNRLMARERGAA